MSDLIRTLFDESANRYARDIAPVLAPLAADFVAYVAPRPTDRALDAGSGTGLVARLLAPYVRRVTGLDLSGGSLRAARQVPALANVRYVQGDITRPPFPAGAFSLVVACFGLNATDPEHSLRALRRLIAPGGRLAIQEWGPLPPLDRAFSDVLADHLPDDPDPRVAALRDQIDAHPDRWSAQLQDADDYADWLSDLGFTVEDARESAPAAVRLPTLAVYLRYKLAWTHRHAEIAALDPAARAAFDAAARARLAAFAAPDGSLIWQPVVFRVMAQKQP